MESLHEAEIKIMNMPLISIIVPVYKVEPYLRKCVDSILAQTYTNIEVILIDDGSPDGCGAICDEYAASDSRVVVIHQENAGVSAARNAGLDAAKGEYIGFVDSDDWIEPDMYELLYHVITASGADIAASYDCIGNEKSKKVNEDEFTSFLPKEAIKKLLDNQHDLTAIWGKLYTRELVGTLQFSSKISIAEDVLFITEAIKKSKKVSYLNYQSYHYTVRADSATHAFRENFCSLLDAVDMIIATLHDFDEDLAEYAANHAIDMDVSISKAAEAKGKFSREAHKKVATHIRKYKSRNTWSVLPFKKKCWVFLLLLGRGPFITGRKVLQAFLMLKNRLKK